MTPSDIVVLKFGSSVLRSPDDLPVAVGEIYRALRLGRRVALPVHVDHAGGQQHEEGDGGDAHVRRAILPWRGG